MKTILFKMIVKVNKRILATIIGIALCVMYLVGTMSMTAGLHTTTEKVADMFEQEFTIVYEGNSLSESSLDGAMVEALPGQYTACIIVTANVSGIETRVLSLSDPYNILGWRDVSLENDVLPGDDFPVGNKNELTITTEYISISVNITTQYSSYTSDILPNNWIIAPMDLTRLLNPNLENKYSFLVIPESNQEALESLESGDLNTMQSKGIVQFFELGIYQVERNLWGIVISSALIIVLLVYNVMKIEILYRVPDIKIIKYLGGSPKIVMNVFLSQALFISIAGAVLGIALGIIGANALMSFTELLGYSSILVPQISLYILGIPTLTAIAAGLAGGFFPAYKASKTTIRTSREVL